MALTKTNLANIVEGILPVANGGTGTSTGVAPGGSTTQVQYNNAGAFGGDSGFIYTGGSVGIGTTSPQQKLVVSNGGAEGLEISPNAIGSGSALISYNRSGAAYTPLTSAASYHSWQIGGTEKMRLDTSGNLKLAGLNYSTLAGPDGSGGWGGGYNFSTNSGTPQNTQTGPISGVYLSSGSSPYVSFYASTTATGGTTATERMRIDSSGNVGIGTTSPGAKLVTTGAMQVQVGSFPSTGNGMEFNFTGGNTGYIQGYDRGAGVWRDIVVGANTLQFATSGSEKMRITAAGGVAFGGSTNYGSSGQVLKSNGDAVPTWGAVSGTAKAYGFINSQSGTSVLSNSFNVSSVTLTGTGQNTINWSTAFANAQYVIVATTNKGDSNNDMNAIVQTGVTGGSRQQTTTQAFLSNGYGGNFQNSQQVCFVVFSN